MIVNNIFWRHKLINRLFFYLCSQVIVLLKSFFHLLISPEIILYFCLAYYLIWQLFISVLMISLKIFNLITVNRIELRHYMAYLFESFQKHFKIMLEFSCLWLVSEARPSTPPRPSSCRIPVLHSLARPGRFFLLEGAFLCVFFWSVPIGPAWRYLFLWTWSEHLTLVNAFNPEPVFVNACNPLLYSSQLMGRKIMLTFWWSSSPACLSVLSALPEGWLIFLSQHRMCLFLS